MSMPGCGSLARWQFISVTSTGSKGLPQLQPCPQCILTVTAARGECPSRPLGMTSCRTEREATVVHSEGRCLIRAMKEGAYAVDAQVMLVWQAVCGRPCVAMVLSLVVCAEGSQVEYGALVLYIHSRTCCMQCRPAGSGVSCDTRL